MVAALVSGAAPVRGQEPVTAPVAIAGGFGVSTGLVGALLARRIGELPLAAVLGLGIEGLVPQPVGWPGVLAWQRAGTGDRGSAALALSLATRRPLPERRCPAGEAVPRHRRIQSRSLDTGNRGTDRRRVLSSPCYAAFTESRSQIPKRKRHSGLGT